MIAVARIVGKLDKSVAVVDGDGELAEDSAAEEAGDFEACASALARGIEAVEVVVLLPLS